MPPSTFTDEIYCTIIGSGNVARSLAAALINANGSRFCLKGIFARSGEKAAHIAGSRIHSGEIRALRKLDGIVFFAIADDAIAEAATQLATLPVASGTLVVHLSGAATLKPLSPLKAAGAKTASLHPIQSFTATVGAEAFEGITASIRTDSETDILIAFAKAIGSRPLLVDDVAKKQLHLAAVFASNYLVVLTHLAQKAAPGVKGDLLRILGPLMEQTLANVQNDGPENALTGPVRRGDAGTIKAHLALIEKLESADELDGAYRMLGRMALTLAEESGRITKEQYIELETSLKP